VEESILISTKKILGIGQNYTQFDMDVITHINSVFSIANQLGVGPTDMFVIEDEKALWSEFDVPSNQLNLVRTWLFLRVRMLFDPPTTSFLIEATNNQILEYETRLSYMRESTIPVPPTMTEREVALWEEEFRETWG
jgi:hypothetical protein